jgi:plastocyanin
VPPADTNPVTVRVIDNDYDPRAIATETGGSVRFTNEGDAQHSVTLQKDGAASAFFDETIQPGQSVLVSFPEAGHYDLRCIYHSIDFDSGQVGDITVG